MPAQPTRPLPLANQEALLIGPDLLWAIPDQQCLLQIQQAESCHLLPHRSPHQTPLANSDNKQWIRQASIGDATIINGQPDLAISLIIRSASGSWRGGYEPRFPA